MVALSASTLTAVLLSLPILANAAFDSHSHEISGQRQRRSSPAHHGLPLARRAASKPAKRCKVKTAVKSTSVKPPKTSPGKSSGTGSGSSPGTSSGSSGTSSGSSGGTKGSPVTSGHAHGTVKVNGGDCGDNGAVSSPTKTSGPNGSIDWINCGINGGGWNPPDVKVTDLVAVSLEDALSKDGSPFGPCKPWLSMFNKYANQYNIPPILIASFAMQESSCKRDEEGQGGEQGIMQISKEKCKGAPDAGCKDPDFNIKTGVAYFADRLEANGGNVFRAAGEYNGWEKGMTKHHATAARFTSCCRCQNNLDYIHQLVNGWAQGIDPGSKNMGEYFNLDDC